MKIVIQSGKEGLTANSDVKGSMPECLGFFADAYVALDKLVKDFLDNHVKNGMEDAAKTSFFDTVEKHRQEER